MCPAGCAQGGIRLQGSESANLGRVEVCMNNIWGTVCENNWGDVDARVVCRQLGFAAAGELGHLTWKYLSHLKYRPCDIVVDFL